MPVLTMRVGNHAQASQATFGRLKLQDGVQGGLISEVMTNKPAQFLIAQAFMLPVSVATI
jgi:hypothetical protein